MAHWIPLEGPEGIVDVFFDPGQGLAQEEVRLECLVRWDDMKRHAWVQLGTWTVVDPKDGLIPPYVVERLRTHKGLIWEGFWQAKEPDSSIGDEQGG